MSIAFEDPAGFENLILSISDNQERIARIAQDVAELLLEIVEARGSDFMQDINVFKLYKSGEAVEKLPSGLQNTVVLESFYYVHTNGFRPEVLFAHVHSLLLYADSDSSVGRYTTISVRHTLRQYLRLLKSSGYRVEMKLPVSSEFTYTKVDGIVESMPGHWVISLESVGPHPSRTQYDWGYVNGNSMCWTDKSFPWLAECLWSELQPKAVSAAEVIELLRTSPQFSFEIDGVSLDECYRKLAAAYNRVKSKHYNTPSCRKKKSNATFSERFRELVQTNM